MTNEGEIKAKGDKGHKENVCFNYPLYLNRCQP